MTLPSANLPFSGLSTPTGPDRAQTGPVRILPFTPPARYGRRPSYTSDEIRQFVLGQGWANPDGVVTNPQALYAEAQRRGIGAPQLDQAGGWAPGTAASYVQQQGWQPLGRQGDARVGPIPGQGPATGLPPTQPQPQPVAMAQPLLGPAPEHAALADAMVAQRTGPNRGAPPTPAYQPAFAQVGQGVPAAGKPQPQTTYSSGYWDSYAAR